MNTLEINNQLIFSKPEDYYWGIVFSTPDDWTRMPFGGETFSFQDCEDHYDIYISNGKNQFSIEIEKVEPNITNFKLFIAAINEHLNNK